jgi:hypothetical protein
LLDYDLALLVIPVLLLIQQGNETGYLSFEKFSIALAVFSFLFTSLWGVQMPVTAIGVPSIVLFALVLRRAVVGQRAGFGRDQLSRMSQHHLPSLTKFARSSDL